MHDAVRVGDPFTQEESMTRALLCLVFSLALAMPSAPEVALAQGRVTTARLQELRGKLEFQRDAYQRLDMAEQEALAEGSAERAEVFHKAKLKAYEAYVTVNAEYQKAQMDKREQDKREAASKPDER